MARSERTGGLRTADTAFRVILCLGCLPTAHFLFFLNSGIGELTPHDPFVFVGENLTMECRVTTKRTGHLSIERNTVPLDSYQEKVGSRAIRLQYPVKHPSDRNLFVCWLHSFGEKKHVGVQLVNIDYPPGKVQNLTCIAPNWRNLTCSWDLPYHYRHPERVNVRVTLSRSKKVNKCCDAVEDTKTSATWSDMVGGTGFVWGHSYWVRVQVVYTTPDGRTFNKSVKRRVRTRDIVKPSPVLEKRECSSNSTSIRVRLYHSDYRHNKTVHIQYSSQWNPDKWTEKNATWPYKTTLREMRNSTGRDVEMSGLQPYTVYTVRVAVGAGQGAGGGHLSDWRTFTLRTQPAAPDVAPELCAGCYSVVSCDKPSQPCFVRLYWKSIPRPLRNGIISGYCLEVVSEDGATQSTGQAPGSEGLTAQPGRDAPNPAQHAHTTSELGDCAPQPEDDSDRPQPGGGGSRLTSSSSLSPAVPVTCAKPEVGDVRLVTETSHWLSLNGSEGSSVRLFAVNSNNQWSRDCSRLFIPSVHDRPAGVEDLVVEINHPRADGGPWNGRFYLRWTDPGPQTAFFTVVWCMGDSSTHTCVKGEDIQWRKVPDPSYNISVENDENHDPSKFIVGVARHQQSQGDVSSGIIWASCLYVRDRVPRVPEIERLTGAGSEGQLSVWWSFKLCDSKSHENVYVTHFLVLYCRVSPLDNSSCDGAEQSVQMSRGKREAVLSGLEGGQPYMVRMVAVSSWGQSRSSKEVVAVAPAERNAENLGVMLAVVIPFTLVVAFVCICCVICKLRNRYKKTSGKFAKTLDGNESGQCTDSRKMAFHERGQVGNTSMLHGPLKQISVNSETPLLTVDDVIREEDEGGLDGFHSHPVRNDGLVSRILDEQRQRSTSALGSEFRRPDGDVEEAAVKTIAGFGVNARKGIQHAGQTCTAAVHVNSKIRNAYVSVGQASATVCPVLLEADGGTTMMTSFTSLPGEVPANSTQSTGENQVELACEEIDTSAPMVCVQESIMTSDEMKSTESLEELCVEFSEPVSEQRTAAQASSAESCHFVHGEHDSRTFSCGGQEQSESSTNAYTRLELDASSKLFEHSVMSVSDTESFTTEGASLTHTSVDSDLDEDAVPTPAMFTTVSGDDIYLAQTEGGVVQSSENMDLAIKTDASLKVSCKDSGGRVFVSSRPVSPSPDSALSCCLTMEEAMHLPSRTSSTESLCTEDKIFVAVRDNTFNIVNGYVGHDGESPVVNGCVAHDGESPVVNGCVAHGGESPVVNGCVAHDEESPVVSGYVAHDGESPVVNGYVAHDGESPDVNGYVAHDGKSLVVNGYVAHGGESPVVNGYVAHGGKSPVVNGYVAHDGESPVVNGCVAHDGESPVVNGCIAHDGESPVVNGCIAHDGESPVVS